MSGIIMKEYGDEFAAFEKALQKVRKNVDDRYKRSLGYFLYELADSASFTDIKSDVRIIEILKRHNNAQEKPGMAGKPNQSADLNKLMAALQQAYKQAMGDYEKITERNKKAYEATDWKANTADAERYFRHKLRELAGSLVAEAGGE